MPSSLTDNRNGSIRGGEYPTDGGVEHDPQSGQSRPARCSPEAGTGKPVERLILTSPLLVQTVTVSSERCEPAFRTEETMDRTNTSSTSAAIRT
jgi:hypothetical protein